ncbi:hypothetical protein Hanom_Chr11g01039451 [Helianthus anomalus]
MLGELITNSLVLILGYAYPAFECFKTLEKHGVENGELRFWCRFLVVFRRWQRGRRQRRWFCAAVMVEGGGG